MKSGSLLIAAIVVGAVCVGCCEEPARAADNAQISGLTDVNFGMISAMVDQSKSQNVVVCSYRGQPNRLNYSVLASGSGGGAFLLASGADTLPYDVQWADSPNQTGGSLLQASVPASGFGNAATGFTCNQGQATASLTVTLRGTDLGSARAGNYSGALQITIAPE